MIGEETGSPEDLQTYPAVNLALPPAVGQLGVDPDDVPLQQGELLRISREEVVAHHRDAQHPRRKHWEKKM